MEGTQPQPRLRDQVRAVIRVNRYSIPYGEILLVLDFAFSSVFTK